MLPRTAADRNPLAVPVRARFSLGCTSGGRPSLLPAPSVSNIRKKK